MDLALWLRPKHKGPYAMSRVRATKVRWPIRLLCQTSGVEGGFIFACEISRYAKARMDDCVDSNLPMSKRRDPKPATWWWWRSKGRYRNTISTYNPCGFQRGEVTVA